MHQALSLTESGKLHVAKTDIGRVQDTESDYNTPRSTLTLPDVPELSATSVPAPSMIRTTTPPPAEAAGTSGGGGRKRVFIPESPVTPVTEQKCGPLSQPCPGLCTRMYLTVL